MKCTMALSYFIDLQGSQTPPFRQLKCRGLVTLLIYKVLKQSAFKLFDFRGLVTLLIYKVLKRIARTSFLFLA